jgi:iron(III) transport system substrate-binding protein
MLEKSHKKLKTGVVLISSNLNSGDNDMTKQHSPTIDENKTNATLKSRLRRIVLTVCSALLIAPATSMAQANDWSAIEAAARKEGKVTLYHNLNPAGAERLANEFRKAYPAIKMEMTRLGSAPLIQRFSTEFSSGRNIADVLITFPDQRIFNGMNAGWMAKWVPPELKSFPPTVNYEGKDMLFNIQTAREAIIWNKQRVKPADAPKEWADLFDPKWKGRIGMNPPWRSVSIQGIVAYWEKLGLGDTAAKLKANDVRFFEGSGGILQAVIRGDVHIAEITDLPVNVALADGAPIGIVYPKSGTTLSLGYMFVAEKAPNINAGKVLANWLMSAKGQLFLQDFAGLPVTRTGIPAMSHLPATSSLPNTIDGLELLPPAKQKEIVDHWRTTFGIQ